MSDGFSDLASICFFSFMFYAHREVTATSTCYEYIQLDLNIGLHILTVMEIMLILMFPVL